MPRLASCLLTPLLLLAGLLGANAANVTWTGNVNANWTTAGNWSPGAPNPDDALIFGASSQLTPDNDYAVGTSFTGLTFNAIASSAYTLTGNSVALNGPVANLSALLHTINMPLVITNAITFNTLSNSASYLSGDLLVGGAVSGAGSVVKNGDGTLTLGSRSYSGGTTINAGTLVVSNDNGSYTMTGGALLLNYRTYYTGMGITSTADSAVGIDLLDNAEPRGIDLYGTINATGYKLTKIGVGILRMVGGISANQIDVAAGTLASLGGSAMAQTHWGTNLITVEYGTTLRADDGGICPNPIVLNGGDGTWDGAYTHQGALVSGSRNNSGNPTNNIFANTITLAADSTIGSYYGNMIISGNITGPGALIKIGANPLVLSGTNTYAGDTTINAGLVQLGSSGALPGGPTNGNVWLNGSTTLDLNGNNATVNGFGDDTLANAVLNNSNPTNPATLSFGGNDAYVSFFGIAKNTGAALGFAKRGAGTASLNGANTFNGGVAVLGGSLSIALAASSVTNGPVSLADGTELSLVKLTAGAALRPSAVTLGTSGSTTLDIDLGSFGNPSVAILTATNGSGTLSVGGNVTINIAGNGNVMSIGQFPLIKYLTRTGTGTFKLGSLPANVVATIVTNAANKSIDLNVSSAPVNKWVGNLGWDWDIGVTKNWTKLGVPVYYADGVGVVFDDSGLTNNVNLTTLLSPLATLVNSASNYTLAGPGSINSGDVVKNGSGTLTLVVDNNFYNNTVVSGGTLQVGNGGDTGSLGQGTVQNDATMVFNRSNNVTVASVITGGGALVKQNTNTLQLSGASTYAGGTTVNQGVLQLGSATALGAPATGVPVATIASGAGLDINGKLVNVGNNLRIGGMGPGPNQGTVFNSGAGNWIGGAQIGVSNIVLTADAALGNDGGMWEVYGTITGNGFNLTKVGNNTLSFKGTAINSPGQVIVGNGGIYFMRANCLGTTATIVLSNNAWMNTWDNNNWSGYTVANNFVIGAGGAQLRNSQGAWYGHANYDTYNGNITLNDTLTLLNTSTYAGAPNAAGVVTHGTMVLNGIISGTNGLFCSAAATDGGNVITLNGVNTYSGPTTITNGTLAITTGQRGGGAYTNMDGATLIVSTKAGYASIPMSSLALGTASGATLSFAGVLTLTTNAPIVATNLTLVGNNSVVLAGSAYVTPGQYPLIKYSSINGGGSLQLGRGIPGSLVTNTANSSIDVVIPGGNPVFWTGSANNLWDIATTANFKYLGSGTTYQQTSVPGDAVTFDDTGINTTINLSAPVSPVLIVVTNTAKTYLFTNSAIAGPGGILKQGSGMLVLSNGANTFAGGATVTGGTLQLGSDGSLNNSSGKVNVSGNGAVDFNNWNPTVLDCTISGAGFNSNGTLVANYTGSATTKGPRSITLAGSAALGGANRWDVRATGAAINTPTNAYTLTKVGANQISIVGAAVSTNLGDILCLGGTLSFETTSAVGDTTKTIYVGNGGGFGLYQNTVPVTKSIVCSNGASILALGGNAANQNILAAPVNLVSGTTTLKGNFFNRLNVSNVLSGAGGITLQFQSTVYLYGTNTYTGDTVVPNCNAASGNLGTRLFLAGNGSIANSRNLFMYGIASGQAYAGYIDVLGRVDGTLTLANGQTLRGDNGSFINGSLVAGSGSTVYPGGVNNIQYTSVSNNLVFQAGSTNRMDVSMNGGVATNDLILVSTNLTYGGTLVINNMGTNALVAGNSFKLFNAKTYAGSFANIVSTTPGQFVTWDTSQLSVNGTVTVTSVTASSVPTLTTSLSAKNLSLTWPPDHLGWTLKTNAVDVSNPSYWFPYPGSSLVTNVTITINPSATNVFFRLSYP